MAEQIRLDTILKITGIDTDGVGDKLAKLGDLGNSSSKGSPFLSRQLSTAKELFRVIEELNTVSKKFNLNLSKQGIGLNNIIQRLDRSNGVTTKIAAITSEIDKLTLALGRQQISGGLFDSQISSLFKQLGKPEGFFDVVRESLARSGKEIAREYQKTADQLLGVDERTNRRLRERKERTAKIETAKRKVSPDIIEIEARGGVDRLADKRRKDREAAEDAAGKLTQNAFKQAEKEKQAREAAFKQAEADRKKEINSQKNFDREQKKILDTVPKAKASQFPNNKTPRSEGPLSSELQSAKQFADQQNRQQVEDSKRYAKATKDNALELKERLAKIQVDKQRADTFEVSVIQKKIDLERKLLSVREAAARVNDQNTVQNVDQALKRLKDISTQVLIDRVGQTSNNIIGDKDVSVGTKNKIANKALNSAFGEILNGGGGPPNNGGVTGLGGSSDDPNKFFEDAKRNIAAVKKNLDQASTSANDFGKAMGLALRRFIAFQIGATALYTVVGVLRTGFTEALKFEEQITAIQQALDGIDTRKLSDSIRGESRKTGTSTVDLVTGIKTLAQAGFDDVAELEIFAERLAKVPLVKSFDGIQETVNGLLAVFGQFNLKGQDTAKVLDQINQFSKDFAVESKDIFAGVTKAGASFSIAGGSLEEFIQLFTVLRSSTRESGEVLGTFFKTGLNQLFRPSSQSFLKQLGVDTNQNIVSQLRQLGQVLDNPSFGNLEKLNIGRKLLDDSRQFPRLLALIRQLADDKQFAKLQQAASNAFGSFDRSTVERIDDVGYSLDRIKTILGDTLNSLIESGGFRNLVKSVADLTSALSPLFRILSQISPLLIAFGTLAFSSKIGETLKNVGSTLALGVGRGNSRGLEDLTPAAQQALALKRKQGFRNIVGGGLALAGGLLGTALSSDKTNIGGNLTGGNLGNAISLGSTVGLLVGAFNPLLGAIVGTTTAFINLTQSAKDNYELNQRAKISNVDINKTSARSNLLSLVAELSGNKSRGFLGDIGASFDFGVGGELARRRVGKTVFGGLGDFGLNTTGTSLFGFLQGLGGQTNRKLNESLLIQEVQKREGRGLGFAEAVSKLATVEQKRQGGDATVASIQDAVTRQIQSSNTELGIDAIRTLVANVFEIIEFKIERGLNGFELNSFRTDNASLNKIFTDITRNLEPISKRLIKNFDSLDGIITNFTQSQSLRRTTDNSTFLNQVFGNNIFTDLKNQSTKFADIITGTLFQIPVRQALADVRSEDPNSTADTVLKSLNLDDLVNEEFKQIVDILSISKGQGADQTLSELAKSTDIKSTVESFNTNIEKVEELLLKTVDKQIDLFNKEISIRSTLNDKLVELSNQTFSSLEEIVQNTFEGQSRALASSQFGKNLPGFIANTQQANLAANQAQQSRFGSITQFAQDFNSLQNALIDSSRNVESINRSGGNVFDQNNRQTFLDNEENRKRFAQVTGELNARLNETKDRLGKAAQATDLLRQAATEFRSELESAGQAVTQYTVQDLARGIAVFNKFLLTSGGGKNVSQGLNSITSKEFNVLTDLLGKLGNIPLGQGLTAGNLLKDINQSLGLRFAATIRSQLSGRSVDTEEQGLRKELASMTAAAESASKAEQKLREDLNSLLDISLQATIRETEAIERQIQVLEAFSQNTIFIDLNKTLQDLKQVLIQKNTPTVNVPGPEAFNTAKQFLTPTLPSFLGQGTPPSNSLFDLVKPSGFSESIIPAKNRFNGYATKDEMYKAQGLAKQQEMEKARAERIAAREGPREAARLDRIRDLLQRKPYLRNQIGQRDLDVIEGRSSASGINQNSDKTAQSTNDPSRGLADTSAKQIDVLNNVASQLSTLNQTSNVIKSTLETIAAGNTNTKFTLEVSPMQVNVALSAPDILKLAGKQLADNVIAAMAPAISQAFGVVSDEAKSVFDGNLGQ